MGIEHEVHGRAGNIAHDSSLRNSRMVKCDEYYNNLEHTHIKTNADDVRN